MCACAPTCVSPFGVSPVNYSDSDQCKAIQVHYHSFVSAGIPILVCKDVSHIYFLFHTCDSLALLDIKVWFCQRGFLKRLYSIKIQVGNDQEMAQSERKSHSKILLLIPSLHIYNILNIGITKISLGKINYPRGWLPLFPILIPVSW